MAVMAGVCGIILSITMRKGSRIMKSVDPGGAAPQSDPPPAYRFSVAIPIRYGDVDAQRHLNNAVYYTFMEHARVSYARELGLWSGEDFDALGMILAEATCTFKEPAYLGETVTVWTRISYLGTKSFHFEHSLQTPRGEIATGHTVQVAYDYCQQRSVPIPEEWRAAIRAYEPGL
jgi:acyl-CoA thioester hydrolase